ncbi:synergin gamma-like [Emydura macquarii macquarii]|uniref:synergin gamma-like n=1 Tax=Emydura macquarii macquarii TaxID=1129001 RepID=UPI00352B5438
MDSEIAQLTRCVQHVHKVIDQANEILSCISQPSVCSEVLLSPAGTAYIWGLAEVYRVSKRVERGMETRKGASELLQPSLREVDLAWNNLQAFLSLCPTVLQRLLSEPSWGGEIHSPGPDSAPDKVCGVCLTEVKGSPEALLGNSDPIFYQDSHYHASCANFWLNCVDSSLPREPVTLFSPS